MESEVQSAILRRYFKFLCERCQNAVPVVGQSRKRTETERERHIIDALFGHAGVFQISAYCNLLPTFSFAYNCSMQSDSKDPRLFTKSRPSTDRVHALAHLRGLLVAFDEIARRYRCIRPWYFSAGFLPVPCNQQSQGHKTSFSNNFDSSLFQAPPCATIQDIYKSLRVSGVQTRPCLQYRFVSFR